MVKGTVKWFITCDDDNKDCFVHYTDIESDGFRTLKEGDRVEFVVHSAPKGAQATEVRKL